MGRGPAAPRNSLSFNDLQRYASKGFLPRNRAIKIFEENACILRPICYITLMQDTFIPAEMDAFIDHLDAQEYREQDEVLVDEMEDLAYGEAVMTSMTVW